MRLRSELKLPHFSLIKVSIRKINDLLRSPQHFNVPVFPLKTTETSLDFNSWANWAPCLRISTGMNINHLCPTWNKIRIANDLWLFCDAVGEHRYSFYRMQTQHLRRDNPSPHLTNAHACRKGEYSLKSSMQWRQVVKPRYIALSRGARSHSLLLPSHPTQHLQGRSCCVGDKGQILSDSRLKPPKSEIDCQRGGRWSDIQYQLNLVFISEPKRCQAALFPLRTVCSRILKLTGEGYR